jgi:hypothetical protein
MLGVDRAFVLVICIEQSVVALPISPIISDISNNGVKITQHIVACEDKLKLQGERDKHYGLKLNMATSSIMLSYRLLSLHQLALSHHGLFTR